MPTPHKKMGRPLKPSDAGNIVAEARAALELSQLELAGRLQVSRAAVAHWEAGRRPIPGPVRLLCQAMLAAKK